MSMANFTRKEVEEMAHRLQGTDLSGLDLSNANMNKAC